MFNAVNSKEKYFSLYRYNKKFLKSIATISLLQTSIYQTDVK